MRPHVISVPYRYDRFEEGLGLGPSRLLEIGLAARAASVHQAILEDADRDDDRTAVNIGILGRSTASLVARARAAGESVLVVAGDDTAAVGVVAGLQASDGASRALGIVWIDAHGDFNTPDTSYSGILAGMPLAVLAGLAGPRWREAAGIESPVPVERMVLVGARDLDRAEEELIRAHDLQRVSVEEVRKGDGLAGPLARLTSTCELLYVNIDMDVLNPHLTPSATTQSEGGFELDELSDILRTVLKTGLVAAVTLTSLNPLGGARGQVSTKSAWQIIQTILTEWDAVPAPPASFS
jgi:arginase